MRRCPFAVAAVSEVHGHALSFRGKTVDKLNILESHALRHFFVGYMQQLDRLHDIIGEITVEFAPDPVSFLCRHIRETCGKIPVKKPAAIAHNKIYNEEK